MSLLRTQSFAGFSVYNRDPEPCNSCQLKHRQYLCRSWQQWRRFETRVGTMSWRRHTWRSDRQLRNAMLLFALTGPLSHVLCVVPVSVCLRVVLNVQVYNETLRDLLAPAGTGRNAPGRALEHASIKHDASGGRMEHTLPPLTSWCSKAAQPVAQSCSSLSGCLNLATAPIAAAGGGTQVTGATRVVIGAADDAEEVMRRAAAARACEVCRQGVRRPSMPMSPAAHLQACSNLPLALSTGWSSGVRHVA